MTIAGKLKLIIPATNVLILWLRAVGWQSLYLHLTDHFAIIYKTPEMWRIPEILSHGPTKNSEVPSTPHFRRLWYACSVNSRRTLNVILLTVPAKFTIAEQNYTAQLGDAVAMDCLSEGDRPLSIAWSFNHGNIDWQYNTRFAPMTFLLLCFSVFRYRTAFLFCCSYPDLLILHTKYWCGPSYSFLFKLR